MERILGLIEELLKELTGVEVIPVFKILCLGENINEFDIAEKIHTNINNTRTLLYKLVNNNLAFSTKKKDKDKGWYIYFWNFSFRHARDLIIEKKTRQLTELNEQEIYKFKQDIQKKYQKGRGKKSKKEKREEKKQRKAFGKKKPKKPVKKSYHGNKSFKGNFYERKRQETSKKHAKIKKKVHIKIKKKVHAKYAKKKINKVKSKKSGLFSKLKKLKF